MSTDLYCKRIREMFLKEAANLLIDLDNMFSCVNLVTDNRRSSAIMISVIGADSKSYPPIRTVYKFHEDLGRDRVKDLHLAKLERLKEIPGAAAKIDTARRRRVYFNILATRIDLPAELILIVAEFIVGG